MPACSSSSGPSASTVHDANRPRDLLGLLGQARRRQLVRRRVHEVAAAVRPAGDDGRAARLLDGASAPGPQRTSRSTRRRGRVVERLPAARVVRPERQPVDDCAGLLLAA